MSATFQACRRRFFFVEKRRVFFEKARFGVPKPCLLRFRLAAGTFFFKKRHAYLKKVCFCQKTDIFNQYWSIFGQYLSIFVNVRTYLLYEELVLNTPFIRVYYIEFPIRIRGFPNEIGAF